VSSPLPRVGVSQCSHSLAEADAAQASPPSPSPERSVREFLFSKKVKFYLLAVFIISLIVLCFACFCVVNIFGVEDEIMAFKADTKTTFEPNKVIQPIYTGGSVGLSEDGRILASCVGEDVLLGDLATGAQLARIEGVCTTEPGPPRAGLTLTKRIGWRLNYHTFIST